MATLNIMHNGLGDEKYKWNPDNVDETFKAKKKFIELQEMGYSIYALQKKLLSKSKTKKKLNKFSQCKDEFNYECVTKDNVEKKMKETDEFRAHKPASGG